MNSTYTQRERRVQLFFYFSALDDLVFAWLHLNKYNMLLRRNVTSSIKDLWNDVEMLSLARVLCFKLIKKNVKFQFPHCTCLTANWKAISFLMMDKMITSSVYHFKMMQILTHYTWVTHNLSYFIIKCIFTMNDISHKYRWYKEEKSTFRLIWSAAHHMRNFCRLFSVQQLNDFLVQFAVAFVLYVTTRCISCTFIDCKFHFFFVYTINDKLSLYIPQAHI